MYSGDQVLLYAVAVCVVLVNGNVSYRLYTCVYVCIIMELNWSRPFMLAGWMLCGVPCVCELESTLYNDNNT